MEIRPILSTVLRNPVGLILIGLQVALTLAIVVNALYIIDERLANLRIEAGVDEEHILTLNSAGFASDFETTLATIHRDLDYLRKRPGVVSAMATNTLPLTQSGWSTEVEAQEALDGRSIDTAIYFADETLVETLGLDLIAGRAFREAEVEPYSMDQELRSTAVIVSAAAALALYPEIDRPEQALGRLVWNGAENDRFSAEIVGIVDGVKAPWKGLSSDIFDHVVYVPKVPVIANFGIYAVRSEPGAFADLLQNIQPELAELDTQRVVMEPNAFPEIRERFLRGDRAMAGMLITVVVLLLLVNILGIVGLVSFWVTQRTRQIGTRRALGATRGNILAYFLVENALISAMGVAVGIVAALALNNWLVSAFGVDRLPWAFLVGGAAGLLVLGIAAACVPALRAAAIPPAIATRSV
ncbi:FtsX-like permease family protein [Mangrovimicrobium sediminis]|uniref:FtsX-like permease family protein n=1 Tax=Mangrovimicrobium sediminis TaxID=2562682 RepID=A0A4Z0M296_9GAMM|nr:FtsX-like permease family protein [Haliea sp. SAOS-164]TGD73557.1 FtsX-like permease family protein [Haliea sp. SAOS-164]